MWVSRLRDSRGLRIQTVSGKAGCILSGSECSIKIRIVIIIIIIIVIAIIILIIIIIIKAIITIMVIIVIILYRCSPADFPDCCLLLHP